MSKSRKSKLALNEAWNVRTRKPEKFKVDEVVKYVKGERTTYMLKGVGSKTHDPLNRITSEKHAKEMAKGESIPTVRPKERKVVRRRTSVGCKIAAKRAEKKCEDKRWKLAVALAERSMAEKPKKKSTKKKSKKTTKK